MPEPPILFNADDFGISPEQSSHILHCADHGCLNGTSLLVNSPRLAQCLPLLEGRALLLAVHLNLTEGRSLTPGLRLLTDGQGRFRQSFFSLALLSLLRRRALRRELMAELSAQIGRGRALLGEDRPLRLDGHQHVQMLPLVMDCLCRLSQEEGWEVEHLRNTAEPIGPFLRHPSLWGRCKPVNWLKNLVLNACALLDRRFFQKLGLRRGLAFGLVLSGQMSYEPLRVLLPDFRRLAARRGRQLELVMHPGWGLAPEDCLDPDKPGFVAFCTGPGRKAEADCLCRLRPDGP